MSGTKEGGLLARDTNYIRQGRDFYQKIGARGGVKGHTGGFYVNRELASTAGRIGGLKSKRGKATYKKAEIEFIKQPWWRFW